MGLGCVLESNVQMTIGYEYYYCLHAFCALLFYVIIMGYRAAAWRTFRDFSIFE